MALNSGRRHWQKVDGMSPRLIPLKSLLRCILLLASNALYGCFWSDEPAILPATAENIGQTLEYRMFNADPAQRNTWIKYTQQSGKNYKMELLEEQRAAEGGGRSAFMIANKVLIRRLAKLGGNTVYVAQIEYRHTIFSVTPIKKYAFYSFRVNGDGTGAAALFRCQSKKLSAIALKHGIGLDCNGGQMGSDDEIVMSGQVSDAVIWKFLWDALESGEFVWENSRRFGVLDFIE